ncbi:hypothetical protein FE374_09365 [Georgenia yuyongxinii]|uniref:DUF3168 domain-containing protein n=1 Tax=Georgenia yuyongxinii TaxID=2589797 RepID=A0A5B8C2H6_9MICO|nr:hypothetical protein [Georgenia yuyongxinii]QDC24793.1 hypothetical protein FE374_09365 [Georgenia yuyongxinii]
MSLTDHRTTLAAALSGAGLQVEAHLPERINPPVAILTPGTPYLEGGDTYGSYTLRFTVLLVTPTAANATATTVLDELIVKAVAGVEGADGFGLERVDQPAMLQANNAQYMSTTVEVLKHIRL